MSPLLLALALLSCCADNNGQLSGPYPRVYMMSAIASNGTPFRSGTTLDHAAIATQAKWDVVMLDPVGDRASSGGDNRPVVEELRADNPNMRLFMGQSFGIAFKCAPGWWWDCGLGWDWGGEPGIADDDADGYGVAGCDTSMTDFAWVREKVIRDHDAILYSLTRDRNNDGKHDAYCNGGDASGHCASAPYVDFAKPGFAQAMADTFLAWAQELPGVWNGLWADEICSSITWTEGNGDSIDYVKSGYASLSAWDAAFQAGIATFFNRLRSQAPVDWLVFGNCGPMAATRNINGWYREIFPSLNGGTWETNMLGWSGVPGDVGYLGDDDAYAKPVFSGLSLQRASTSTPQSDLTAQRLHRWILGSATLGEGGGTITRTTQDPLRGYLPWWADEFSVTPAGESSPEITYRGWLGRPLGEHYAVTGGGWRRDFQGGSVLVNPKTSGTVTFPLGEGFYRIKGIVCPSVNTGAKVTSVVINAQDALFVQRRPPLP